jgi:flagellar basal body-associated protein FliL
MVPKQPGANTVKLTGPVKVVQVPVAGQPGRYVTGILPIVETPEARSDPPKRKLKPWLKIMMLVIVLVLVIASSLGVFLFAPSSLGTFWFVHSNPFKVTNQTTGTHNTVAATPNAATKAMAQATATTQANIVLSDPLSTNIHNWLVTPPDVYAFKNGAYHITDRGNNGRAAVLLGQSFTEPVGYTLTMQEVNGDDGSANNSFGMIFRFNQQSKGGTTVTTFYSFEVVNMKGGEYQFWKYDDSKGANTSPWTKIWSAPFGDEFHLGHAAQSANTFKVFMNGGTFTITVNGKTLNQTVKDGTFASGMVGMIVNLNGTEVAFSNLLLTRN